MNNDIKVCGHIVGFKINTRIKLQNMPTFVIYNAYRNVDNVSSDTFTYDYFMQAVCKNADNAASLYTDMKRYNIARIEKTNSHMVTFEDVHVMSMMHVSSIDVYRYAKGYGFERAYNRYVDAWSTYRFYAYDIIGRDFVHKPIQYDRTIILSAKDSTSTFSYDNGHTVVIPAKFNCQMLYTLFKGMTSNETIRTFSPTYTIRKRNTDNDTPREYKRGLVSTDYYISRNDPNNKQLKRDRYNDTQGNKKQATVELLRTLFKKDIRESENARHTISVYNSRCVELAKKQHADKVTVVYAKRHNVKVALYAILFKQNEKPKVIYFSIESGIAYSREYRFKNNKVAQIDLVRLATVKQGNKIINIDSKTRIFGDLVYDRRKATKSK